MLTFIRECGPYGIPLIVLCFVVFFLIIRKTTQLYSNKNLDIRTMEHGTTAIIFWGAFSVVLGLLGQWSAIYKSLSAIIAAESINPQRVVMGMKESFNTTIWGFSILLVSGLAWFILRARLQTLASRKRPDNI